MGGGCCCQLKRGEALRAKGGVFAGSEKGGSILLKNYLKEKALPIMREIICGIEKTPSPEEGGIRPQRGGGVLFYRGERFLVLGNVEVREEKTSSFRERKKNSKA